MARTGILLINLGTPDAPDPKSVRRYLKEFLSDPRVIEKRGPLWWLVLNGIILPRRSGRSSTAYRLIWDAKLNDSPLRIITRSQAGKLSDSFAGEADIIVEWAMRYGNPSIKSAVARLEAAGCDRLLPFPLYPQYSAATTATALDKVFDALKTMRRQPSVRTVPPYFNDPAYIDAVAQSVREHIASLAWMPDICLASFHGLPEAFIDAGDPYRDHCEVTTGLLRKALGMDAAAMPLVYQSRGGGRATWIGPSLEETLTTLAGKGVKNLCVVTPGFASDCIETLEELRIRAARTFLEHGGENFTLVPCLNDSDLAVALLRDLTDRNLGGW